MMQDKFSWRQRAGSFKYAFNGIFSFFRAEPNAVIHLLATVMVAALAIIMKISNNEMLFLVLVTGLVWITELLNTAIERIMDFISFERKPEIKMIKDIAAAAVLVAAAIALITGAIIFIPKF
jgi:diacylglycerol kinase (ATP)